jgi:hypothetical protein
LTLWAFFVLLTSSGGTPAIVYDSQFNGTTSSKFFIACQIDNLFEPAPQAVESRGSVEGRSELLSHRPLTAASPSGIGFGLIELLTVLAFWGTLLPVAAFVFSYTNRSIGKLDGKILRHLILLIPLYFNLLLINQVTLVNATSSPLRVESQGRVVTIGPLEYDKLTFLSGRHKLTVLEDANGTALTTGNGRMTCGHDETISVPVRRVQMGLTGNPVVLDLCSTDTFSINRWTYTRSGQ